MICLSVHGQSKHALLVAVGNYEEDTEWAKLSSVNDIDLIEQALIHRGFKKENILRLVDEEVTKKGVKDVFEERVLAQVKSGDIFYFHFSGH